MPAGIVAATNRSRNRAPKSDARGVAVSFFPRKYKYTRYGKRPAWNSLVSMPANRSPKSASALPPPTDHASTETSATRRAVPRDAEPVTAASSASEGSARGGARRRALLGRHRRRDRAMTAVSTSTVRARCAAAGARRDRAERDSARLPDAHPRREAAPDPATAHMTSAACNGARVGDESWISIRHGFIGFSDRSDAGTRTTISLDPFFFGRRLPRRRRAARPPLCLSIRRLTSRRFRELLPYLTHKNIIITPTA